MSQIDPNYPPDGAFVNSPELRAQFSKAKAEIENLQAQINAISAGGSIYLVKSQNLADLTDPAAARANLGITSNSQVANVVASRNLNTSESRTTFTNVGATDFVMLSLPAAQVGLEYGGLVRTQEELIFDCNGTDTIENVDDISDLGGFFKSAIVGSYIYLKCFVQGVWTVTEIRGTWSFNNA